MEDSKGLSRFDGVDDLHQYLYVDDGESIAAQEQGLVEQDGGRRGPLAYGVSFEIPFAGDLPFSSYLFKGHLGGG